jgi:hypothetical protein
LASLLLNKNHQKTYRALTMKNILKTLTAAAAIVCSGAASATVLTTTLHVDNVFQAYVSTSDSVEGTFFSFGGDWPTGYVDSVELAANTDYYLHVRGMDQGGIAGMLGQFALAGTDHRFANGQQLLFTDTVHWKGGTNGFNGNYQAVTDLGANGVGPWGHMGDTSNDARWIWVGDANANNLVYFSTKISAVQAPADLPEPGSVALLGLGLAGLGLLRRRKA